MHAQTVDAANWWAADRANSKSWIENYQKSLKTRHRNVIAAIVNDLKPKTLLEIGCHCGPNLIRLAQELPAVQLVGMDANAQAIDAGKAWAASLGLGNRIQLHTARFPEGTDRLETGVVDVVLSCYTLAYVSPADLDAALYEVGRLAKRAVILAEPMGTGMHGTPGGYQEWAHVYDPQWIGSWQGMTWTSHDVSPPVDRLNAVRVGVRNSQSLDR